MWTRTFAYERGDGSRMYLTWFNGEIVIAGVGRDRARDVASMQPIAWSLGAHLADNDGKVLSAGESTRYGMVRGVVPLSIGLVCLAIGMLVGAFAKWVPHHQTPGAVTAVVLIAIGLVGLACHLSIVLFNRPTWLIPPYMRGDGQARSRRRG
jgi:drug/metabolite transporter (DMT)-like permease